MAKYNEAQVAAALDLKSANLTSDDIARIASSWHAVKKIIGEFPDQYAKTRKQAKALFNLLESKSKGGPVSDASAATAAGALIYLASPMDIVPDDESEGFEDDAAVITLAIARAKDDLKIWCEKNEKNLEDYL